MQALWSNEHALAWHLGPDFQADPVAWARQQCQAWEELEDQLPNFLDELPDCPCTLAQARADSGRFHVSPRPLGWGRAASEGARGAPGGGPGPRALVGAKVGGGPGRARGRAADSPPPPAPAPDGLRL